LKKLVNEIRQIFDTMAITKEDSKEECKESCNEIIYQGTSKGVSRERNSTSHKVIFVDNLPSSMDKNGFINLFRKYGLIVDFKFLKHKTGAETGYGFVEFRDWDDGRKAILEMNCKLIDQRRIRVIRARPPTNRVSMTNLYVENVPKSWSDETITVYFSKICKITHARILVNRKNGQSRGVGFVHCYSNDDAKTAIHYINVENRGREGDLNLFVKFAKVPKAERKMHRMRGGYQERRKWVSRHYQAQDSFEEHYQMGIVEDCKMMMQLGRSNLLGGRCEYYSQRQHRSGSRSPKFNRNKNLRNTYEKHQSNVSTNGVLYGDRKRAMDVKESDHQYPNFFLPSHIPMQSNSQVLTHGPIKGVIAPTMQQTYCGDQEMINTGVPPKENQVAPVSQIQIPSGIKQQTQSTDIEAPSRFNWPSEQQQGQCLWSETWSNNNYADHCVANDAISKGFPGKVLYPNNSCITPVMSNRSVGPYQWSPLVTPVVGTPVGVASPIPFFAHLIGSPGGIPNFQANANQISQTPRSPSMLACSKFRSPINRAQPNAFYWPPSPLTVNQRLSLASPLTLRQQMSNFSLDDTRSHINPILEEKEPSVNSSKSSFEVSRSLASHTYDNKTSNCTPGKVKGRLIAAAACREYSESHSKLMHYATEEKQQSEQICKV